MDKQEQVNTPFEAGTDFIPLDVDSEITHGERDRDTRRKGKERERERTRDANSPQPLPPKSRKGRDRQEQANVSFEAGTDFIPLDDDSDVEYERSRETRRGRHAAHSPSPPSAPPPPLPPQDSRIPEGVQENGNGHPREWDRGKRKYDMVFDPSDGYQNKKQRTDAKSRLAPWVEHVDWEGCKNTAELFHREVEGFVNWISPTPQEDEIRGLVVAIISHAVTSSFPDAAVFPFGSYATKLYLPLGDIDLVIRSPSMAYADKHAVLTALAATIRRSGLTNKVTIIAKAKVPIVKFVTNHEYGRFAVDLSINQDNGIVAGHIINGFLQQFGSGSRGGTCLALRALVLLTKLFLSQRGMNEVYTGGLGSYAIVCLVISFLQMHPKIRHGQIDADANLGVLVVEFFELYGRRFHYEEVGISLREGGSYFSKRQRGWGWGEQWGGARKSGGLLSIEDPGDPSNDISSGSYNFQNVRKNLAGAHEILIATIYLRAGILEARRGGQSFSLRDRYEPGDMSILSSVLGVTQETLNNRALVKEVYEKQTLHRLVGVSP
ncbi:Nucleotidyltransferase, partial [Mycena crocata]